MTRNVVTALADTSVPEIAALLLLNGISALPVVDGAGRVIGIVGEGDLLGRPPAHSVRASWLRLFDGQAVLLEEIANARNLKARDVMTAPAVTVVEDTPLDVLATLMRRCRIKRLPVLHDGRLAGIVSRADLLEALMRDPQPECCSG